MWVHTFDGEGTVFASLGEDAYTIKIERQQVHLKFADIQVISEPCVAPTQWIYLAIESEYDYDSQDTEFVFFVDSKEIDV
jgi:hypothetical protein